MTKRTKILTKSQNQFHQRHYVQRELRPAKPINPYTTEGNSDKQFNSWLQDSSTFGETSVIKTAAPMAKGVAIRADRIVTMKEPKIMGRAPNCLPEGFQVCPNRKSKILNPIDKEGRQTFLDYENQNHSHNDNNQRQTGKGQAFPEFL